MSRRTKFHYLSANIHEHDRVHTLRVFTQRHIEKSWLYYQKNLLASNNTTLGTPRDFQAQSKLNIRDESGLLRTQISFFSRWVIVFVCRKNACVLVNTVHVSIENVHSAKEIYQYINFLIHFTD